MIMDSGVRRVPEPKGRGRDGATAASSTDDLPTRTPTGTWERGGRTSKVLNQDATRRHWGRLGKTGQS